MDNIFDLNPEARIGIYGVFNAEPGEAPVEAMCGPVENKYPESGHAGFVGEFMRQAPEEPIFIES